MARDLFAAPEARQPTGPRDLFASPGVEQAVPEESFAGMSDITRDYLSDTSRSDVPVQRRLQTFKEKIASGEPEHIARVAAVYSDHDLGKSIKEDVKASGRFVSGIPGALPTIASGMVAEPVAGLAGIAQSVNPFAEEGAGARAVEATREALTIDPIGTRAEETLSATGEALSPLLELPGKAGEATLEATDSPALATGVETVISAVPDILGIKGAKQVSAANKLKKANRRLFDEGGLPVPAFDKALKKKGLDFGALIGEGDNIPLKFGDKNPDQLVESIIKRKLQSGDQSEALYKFKVSNGKVVPDELGEEALKQGFRKGDIASAKTSNRDTRHAMVEMLRKKRAIESNQAKALDFRPSDVVGKSAMQRFNFIRQEALSLRKQLDHIAGKLTEESSRLLEGPGTVRGLANRKIDIEPVSSQYMDGLESLEVAIDTSTIPPKLDFKNSLISEDKTSQRVIKSVTNILSKDKPIDARQAHLVKRQLDTMLDFNKKSAAGLTESGEKFAKSMRKAINEVIRDVSPDYARVNDKLSESLGAMKDFDKALGGIDAFGENAQKAVGQTLRRLLSNAQSRVSLDDALTSLDDTAKGMGGVFDTDTRRLILFNKTLDERFGATARGSLQGEIESAARSGPKQAARDFAIKKGAEKLEELRGINDTNAFNAMERILKRAE